jgi:iron complex transport system substrate-binding protein
MRGVVGALAGAAILAFTAWTAAVPPPPVADDSLRPSTVPPGAFPKVVRDPLGARAVISGPPKRIVSLELASDELLLELVEPDRIAGLTHYIDDPGTSPSHALAPRSSARLTEEEPEALLALAPDLVLTTGYARAEPILLLETARVPVLCTGALASLDDVTRAITMIGNAVGEPARADALVASMRARMAAVKARAYTSPLRVLVWEGGYTYARGTMPDDLVTRAGGINVASDAGLRGPVAVTEEAAVTLRPDVIVVPSAGSAPRMREVSLVGDGRVWRAVPAVRSRRVYGVPRAWMGSVSHHAVRALEALAAVLEDARREETP